MQFTYGPSRNELEGGVHSQAIPGSSAVSDPIPIPEVPGLEIGAWGPRPGLDESEEAGAG